MCVALKSEMERTERNGQDIPASCATCEGAVLCGASTTA